MQLKAAGANPIQWVCQDPADAAALAHLLDDFSAELRAYGPNRIEVVTVVPETGTPV